MSKTVHAKSSILSNDRQNTLSRYFSEMGDNLLDAESEASLAGALREADEAVWKRVLSEAALASEIASLIDTSLDAMAGDKSVSTRSLKTAATKVLRSSSDKTRASLERVAAKVAAEIRETDPDQEVLIKVISWLKAQRSSQILAQKISPILTDVEALRKETFHLRNQFVESNLGLVVSVARRYQFSGMSLADLIQEGNLGLLKAVSRFDERKGFRFSTYATWWIRHAIGRGVADKSRTVRVPVHVSESNQKLKRTAQDLRLALGREPLREEIAEASGLSMEKMEKIQRSTQVGGDVSLDASLGDDGERERLEVFVKDDEDSVFDKLSFLSLSGKANEAMLDLAPLEIEILNRRFGLAGKRATTLQEIANTVGKSRERIRQIQEKALLKLRERLIAEHAV